MRKDHDQERLIVSLVGLEVGRNPVSLSADLSRLEMEDWFTPTTPLEIHGYLDYFGDMVTIRADAQATVERTCGRCAGRFSDSLAVEVFVLSDRAGADDEKSSRELEQDGYLVYHDGTQVDITTAVRESIILSEPMNPLCKAECKGLCAACGADLNLEACRCTAEKTNPRWAALEQLKKRND